MRVWFAALFIFCLWSSASLAQNVTVRWLAPAIDCTADHYPHYVNPFDVYAQTSEVLKKRRPDGILFFSVNIVFGMCSSSQKVFLPQGSRSLTVINTEKWPWQKLPFVHEVNAYEQLDINGKSYNKLEIRVDEDALADELTKKKKVSVTVGYHDVHLRGVRVKWIFENSPTGIKARIEAIP